MTARNWLVGYYIVEFEQHGEDRAKYGEKLLSRLSESLNQRGFNLRRLRDYRHVYQVYPYLGVEIVKYLESNGMSLSEDGRFSIRLFSTAEFQKSTDMHEIIRLSKTAELEEWSTPPERLFYRLNYTILSCLATINDPLKRAFYEQETIRGCWTVTELDRQVSSRSNII
ncbi:MAG: hypothetical protein J5875_04645 [Paludibacteraceae bacterium]|nr:hypothetical protein [Paludibacteraceae bacterium]